MRFTGLFVAAIFAIECETVRAEGKVEERLAELRAQHQKERASVKKPLPVLILNFEAGLVALRGELTRAGKIEEALVVQGEIDTVAREKADIPNWRVPGDNDWPGKAENASGTLKLLGFYRGRKMALPNVVTGKKFSRVFSKDDDSYSWFALDEGGTLFEMRGEVAKIVKRPFTGQWFQLANGEIHHRGPSLPIDLGVEFLQALDSCRSMAPSFGKHHSAMVSSEGVGKIWWREEKLGHPPTFNLDGIASLMKVVINTRREPYVGLALDRQGALYGWNPKGMFAGLSQKVGEPVTDISRSYKTCHALTHSGRVIEINSQGDAKTVYDDSAKPAIRMRTGASSLIVQIDDGTWRLVAGRPPLIEEKKPFPGVDPEIFTKTVAGWATEKKKILDVAVYSLGHTQWMMWIEGE